VKVEPAQTGDGGQIHRPAACRVDILSRRPVICAEAVIVVGTRIGADSDCHIAIRVNPNILWKPVVAGIVHAVLDYSPWIPIDASIRSRPTISNNRKIDVEAVAISVTDHPNLKHLTARPRDVSVDNKCAAIGGVELGTDQIGVKEDRGCP
jgi:hypothetical protein